MDLLRKKDLHPKVGVAKSTVADWVEDFNVYIPKTKHGNITYYKPEAIDVLLFIKQCRDHNYQKHQIMEMLSEKGFPITVEEAVEDVKRALEGDSPRDTLLAVMQTMGQAVGKLAEQDERLDEQEEILDQQHERLLEQNGRLDGHEETLKTLEEKQGGQDERLNGLEKRTDEIEYLKQEIQSLRLELAATQEKKKNWLARLFGK